MFFMKEQSAIIFVIYKTNNNRLIYYPDELSAI